jgi:hypothetical protein
MTKAPSKAAINRSTANLDDEKRAMKRDVARRRHLMAWGFGLLIAALAVRFGIWIYPRVYDEHRIVSRRMGWQCTGITNTSDPRQSHVESAKFWYIENPRYEERESGPTLCTDLENASSNADVEMVFDTWGNTTLGLHGYDTIKLVINGKSTPLYGGESGGFHDYETHYGNFDGREDKRLHPEKYHFPPNTFRP